MNRRFVFVLLGLVVCSSLVGPGFLSRASAQPLCLGETAWSEEAKECVPVNDAGTPAAPEEAPLEGDTPPAEASPPAGEVPDQELTGLEADSEFAIVYLYVNYCDDSQNWITFFRDNPNSAGCQLTPHKEMINFYLARDGGHIATATTAAYTTERSMAKFENVLPGALRVSMDFPRGYSVYPAIFCSTWDDSSTPDIPSYRVENLSDYSFDVPLLEAGQFAICGLSFIPTERSATVDIVVYACPADFDTFHFTSVGSRRETCNEPVPETYFTVKEFRGYSVSFYATPDDHVVSFPQVLPGFIDVRGSTPEGYQQPFVFCETVRGDERLKLYEYQTLYSDKTIRYEILTPTGEMYCDWFLFAEGASPQGSPNDGLVASGSPEAEQSATTPATLTVQFWSCPDGLGSADYDAYLVGCTTDSDSRSVELTTDNGVATETVLGGELEANLPPSGAFSVKTNPEPLAVYCSQTSIQDGELEEQFPEVAPLTDGALSIPADENTRTIYCDWFGG